MTFSEKLIALRRRHGLSQEDLAQRMDVSRQAVSKWESGQAMPDVNRLIQLSKQMDISLDYLLRDDFEMLPAEKAASQAAESGTQRGVQGTYPCYEYKSRLKVGSLLLVHIKLSPYGVALAKGVIAIGNAAIGGIAIGGVSVGGVAIGGIGVGAFALGGLSVGLLALGGLSVGYAAVGACGIGRYAFGSAAVAQKVGIGLAVHAPVAIALDTDAQQMLSWEQARDPQTLKAFIEAYAVELPGWMRRIIAMLAR